MPKRLLSRFAKTLAASDETTLGHVQDFAAWYRQQHAAPFAPYDEAVNARKPEPGDSGRV